MSLIKAMQFASRVRKKYKKYKKPKRQGLRGGMWAKKQAISGAYSISALGAAGHLAKSGRAAGLTSTQRFGRGRGLGHKAVGESRAHFAKRYPKTDVALGVGKVAAIGATGAWLLNDKDMKKGKA